MKKPTDPKERNLLVSAIRRAFSRSNLRTIILRANVIKHEDPSRPRVKTWYFCSDCGTIDAGFKFQVDHLEPVIRLGESVSDLTWDQLIEERVWCDPSNLKLLCIDCHAVKSKAENSERRRLKKERK